MNANDTMPNYLYHYTTLDTLALILANRTIRLNSLNNMDDVQEQEAADLRNPGKIVYVSSWTSNERESIPMWRMYSSLDNGIRIKLKIIPFKEYSNTPNSFKETGLTVNDKTEDDQYLKTYIPLANMINKGFISPSVFANNPALLKSIEYSDDPNKLYPKLLDENDGKTSIKLGLLGKVKNKYWEFQEEWRYIMYFYPISLFPIEKSEDSFKQFMIELMNGTVTQPFPYLDLSIADDAFQSMEITLSPCMNEGKKIIARSLVEKFNPSCVINESNLTGLISK